MSTPSLIDRQRTLLRELAGLAAEKAQAEPALAARYRAEVESAAQTHAAAREELERSHLGERDSAANELRDSLSTLGARAVSEREAIQKEYFESGRAFTARLDAEAEQADAAGQNARLAADAILDAGKQQADVPLHENNARLAARVEDYQKLAKEANDLVISWKLPIAPMESKAAAVVGEDEGSRKISECIGKAAEHLDELRELVLPRFLRGKRLLFLTVLFWLISAYPLGWLTLRLINLPPDLGLLLGVGAGVGGVLAILLGVMARAILRSMARKQVESVYVPFLTAIRAAQATRQRLLRRYQRQYDQSVAEAAARAEQESSKALTWERKAEEIRERRAAGLADLAARRDARLKESEDRRVREAQAAEQRHAQRQERIAARVPEESRQLEQRHRTRLEDISTQMLREWHSMVERWRNTLTSACQIAASINEESDALFPGWDLPCWDDRQPPPLPPSGIRFGSFTVRAEAPAEQPPWAESRTVPPPIDLTLPALSPFPEPASLLLRARDEGREQAAEVLRTMMFRLLTSLPAGRVRFTIIDAVGLGQNFATFMNLADHDEALVGGRVWTEPTHIEQRLADLTAYVETVIQKYLRNRYSSISEYNAHAGEVAEPFRVLVVANFPTNFTAESVRRLVSLAQSGPRCGVFTLMSVDTRQPTPREFDLNDLRRCCTDLEWDAGQFRRVDEDFAPYPLALDRPPGEEFCNHILHRVGEAARAAQRVEVPFEFIAPQAEDYWTATAAREISVPLGRSGATRRQHLKLGVGTSQHALIVGKTGSGKSTLLHALVTNLALLYGPDEVELYLVDFKKGVEFSTYAANELPHARVIAIESDREFGLSVLQRLDAELKERGQRFRAAGTQDLAGYRRAAPEARSPRVMLVVDEFQEFFVEDDRLAQEAAQLLDRLVRQGRAFGLHVLLGSQTLGGAYSLARSTIDQMAVRIALQCSEADAQLIFSEDNSAARLLSRPGEAIYNDANGLAEGNDPFQVVWLGDDRRDEYLAVVRELARQRSSKAISAVVFEGNAPADVSKNRALARLISGEASAPEGRDGEEAWLGEAMAIDGLTSAVFRRQNGSNLLIVGQQPESALGMLSTAVISLAARPSVPPSSLTRFWVVDGTQGDPPRAGVLAELPDILSEPVRLAGSRELPAVLVEWSSELQRRQDSGTTDAPSMYLILHALQRLRELRRREDDFGFGRAEDRPTPERQLAVLLREGAALGMHVLIWCDTLGNVQRAFDRSAMREFALRVLFQMSVADSSNLIDSPLASKLGANRALFSNEEDGCLQKFRPYGPAPHNWLCWVREASRRVPAPGGTGSMNTPNGEVAFT